MPLTIARLTLSQSRDGEGAATEASLKVDSGGGIPGVLGMAGPQAGAPSSTPKHRYGGGASPSHIHHEHPAHTPSSGAHPHPTHAPHHHPLAAHPAPAPMRQGNNATPGRPAPSSTSAHTSRNAFAKHRREQMGPFQPAPETGLDPNMPGPSSHAHAKAPATPGQAGHSSQTPPHWQGSGTGTSTPHPTASGATPGTGGGA